jgi:ABC-2 type transport system permease protein
MRVFMKSLRDNRRGWIGWTLALTAIAAMYASFYPSINNPAMADALNSFPQGSKRRSTWRTTPSRRTTSR